MTRAVRTVIAITFVVGLALVLGWLGAKHVAQRATAAPLPISYYLLQPGQVARFAIDADAPIHISVRVPNDGVARARYGLAVRLVARDSHVLATRALDLPVRSSPTPGDETSAIDRVTVTPVADTAWLELEASLPPLAVQVTRAIARRRSSEARLAAAGIDPRWLAADEVHALDPARNEIVPAVGDLPVVELARATRRPPSPPAPPTPLTPRPRVDARQRAVFNVVGPGRAAVRVDGAGAFDVTFVGASPARTLPIATDAAPINLPSGVTSLVISARGAAAGTPSIALSDGARPVEPGPPLPATHRTPARWLARGEALTFPIRGNFPIRVSARGVADAQGTIRVELIDAAGVAVDIERALEPSPIWDPFSAAEQATRHEPLRQETSLLLVPPPAARTLRVTTALDVIVAVDVRIEEASDVTPAPPYDLVVPSTARFVDVPAKAALWFPLPPPVAAPKPGTSWTLVRTPRLEPVTVPVPRTMIAVQPRGGVDVGLREPPFAHMVSETTTIATGIPARVVVPATGLHARTLALRCEAREQIGGEVRVRLDGHDASAPPLLSGRVDITVATSPGPHVVELGGTPVTCVAHARGNTPAALVARHAFRVDRRRGVVLDVARPPLPLTVSCAVYTTSPATTIEVEVVIDGGTPARRVGAAQRLTTGRRVEVVPLVDGVSVPGAVVKRALVHVPVGDDLGDVRHTIEIHPAGTGALWARCWMPGERAHNEKVTTWFTTED